MFFEYPIDSIGCQNIPTMIMQGLACNLEPVIQLNLKAANLVPTQSGKMYKLAAKLRAQMYLCIRVQILKNSVHSRGKKGRVNLG